MSESKVVLITLVALCAVACGGQAPQKTPEKASSEPTTTSASNSARTGVTEDETPSIPPPTEEQAQTMAAEKADVPPEAMAKAKEIYATRCAPCHGASGAGDGAAAAALKPAPRDYSDAEWQASVTDQYIEEVILKGGAAKGLSPLMPPNPDLSDKPQVIDGLRAIVRSFGEQAS